MKFLTISGRKNRRSFPAGRFILVLQVNVCLSTLISIKLPCSKKVLVTRLVFHFCDWLHYFVAFYQILLIFLTLWIFLNVIPLLNISSKFKSQYLDFYSFYSIFLGKDCCFQEKALYRSTATIQENNVLVTIRSNLYKDVCR